MAHWRWIPFLSESLGWIRGVRKRVGSAWVLPDSSLVSSLCRFYHKIRYNSSSINWGDWSGPSSLGNIFICEVNSSRSEGDNGTFWSVWLGNRSQRHLIKCNLGHTIVLDPSGESFQLYVHCSTIRACVRGVVCFVFDTSTSRNAYKYSSLKFLYSSKTHSYFPCSNFQFITAPVTFLLTPASRMNVNLPPLIPVSHSFGVRDLS